MRKELQKKNNLIRIIDIILISILIICSIYFYIDGKYIENKITFVDTCTGNYVTNPPEWMNMQDIEENLSNGGSGQWEHNQTGTT